MPKDTLPTAREDGLQEVELHGDGPREDGLRENGLQEGLSSPLGEERSVCHLCRACARENDGEEGSHREPERMYFKLFENNLPEEAHGWAGQVVKRMGSFSYIIFLLIPLLFVSIMFAIIPLGQPQVPRMREQWVFLFISNSTVFAVIAYLYTATFLGMAAVARPFRTSVIPPLAVFAIEMIVFAPILLRKGVFDLLGIVSFALCVLTTLISIFFVYPDHRPKLIQFSLRFMLLMVLFVAVLTGYVILYRGATRAARNGLVFAMSFVTFIYRRIMLSRLDQFPLDLSLILSGFWVQNLNDIFQTMAFPQLTEPSTFFSIWLANSFGNIAFLGFVSNLWVYTLRPFLKTYVKNGAKCNFPIPPLPKPDHSFDPANRGHDDNVGGYRRRQFRFFFWRLLSQFASMALFLAVAPILRFGFNKEYTLFGNITGRQFRNSMIYPAVNLCFVFGTTLLGYLYVNKRHHPTFHEMRQIHGHEFINHTFVGYNVLIMAHNLFLAVGVVLHHNCIFTAFREECRFDAR